MTITVTPLLAQTLLLLRSDTGTRSVNGAYADGRALNAPAVQRLIDSGLVQAELAEQRWVGTELETLRLTDAGREALPTLTIRDAPVMGKRLDASLANLAATRYFTMAEPEGRRHVEAAEWSAPTVSARDVDSLLKRGLVELTSHEESQLWLSRYKLVVLTPAGAEVLDEIPLTRDRAAARHRVLGKHILSYTRIVRGRHPIRGMGELYGSRASCSCGWSKTSNSGRADAEDDGRAHIESEIAAVHNEIDLERAGG